MADPSIQNQTLNAQLLAKAIEYVNEKALELYNTQEGLIQIISKLDSESKSYVYTITKQVEEGIKMQTTFNNMGTAAETFKTKIVDTRNAIEQQNAALIEAQAKMEQYRIEAQQIGDIRYQAIPAERRAAATPEENLAFTRSVENLSNLMAKQKADILEVSQLWENLRTNKIEPLPQRLQAIRDAILKIESASRQVGETQEINNQKQIENQAKINEVLLREVQINEQLLAKEEALNQARAAAAQFITQRITAAAAGGGLETSTTGELTAYTKSLERITELAEKHQVSLRELNEIWEDLQSGDVKLYDKRLGDIRDTLTTVEKAEEKLGSTQRKNSEAELNAIRKEISALEEKDKKIKQELQLSNRQIELRRQATIEASKAAAQAVRLVSANLDRVKANTQASIAEKAAYTAELSNLANLVQTNKTTTAQIEILWKNLSQEKINVYDKTTQQVVNQLLKIKTAEEKLGSTYRKEANERAKQFVALNKLQAQGQKLTQTWTLSWRSWSRIIAIQLVHRAVSGLVQSIREGITAAQEFQIKLGEVQTISQNFPLTLQQWRDGLIEVSNAWGIEIFDQVEGAYQTLSNQVAEGAETFRFLAESNRFAVTAVASSTDAVNLLTATLNAYQLATEDADEAAASWFKTIELGRLRAADLSTSLGDVAILARQSGVSLNELQAAISTITIQGVQVSKAMTQLRGIFVKLLKPTKDMKEFLRDIGVESGEAAIQTYGFGRFMELLQERTRGSSTELAKYVNRIRGLSGALIFTGEGLKTFENNWNEVRNAQESYDKATELIINTSGKKLQQTLNRLSNYFIKLGDDILETTSKATNGFQTFETTVVAIVETIKELVTSIGFVVTVVGILATKLAILAVSNPFFGILAAVTAVTAAIIYNQKVSEAAAQAEFNAWKAAYTQRRALQIEEQSKMIKDTENFIEETGKLHQQKVAAINKYYFGLTDKIKEYWKESTKYISSSYELLINDLSNQLNIIKDEISTLESNIQKLINAQKTLEERRFELSIRDFAGDAIEAEEKIKLITEELERLRQISQEAVGSGDVDRFEESRKRIIELQEKLNKLQEDAYKEVENQEKELQKQREQLAKDAEKADEQLIKNTEKRKKLEQDILNLKREAEKIRRTPIAPEKPSVIKTEYDKQKQQYDEQRRQEKINSLREKYNQIQEEIKEKEKQIEDFKVTESELNKEVNEKIAEQQKVQSSLYGLTQVESTARQAILDHLKEEEELREQLRKQQESQLQLARAQEATLKVQQLQLEYLFNRYKDFDLEKVLEAPDAEKQIERQIETIQKLIETYQAMGVDQKEIDELIRQQNEITTAYELENIRKLEEARQNKIDKERQDDAQSLERYKKDLTEREKALEEFNKTAAKVSTFSQVDKDAQDITRREFTSIGGLSKLKQTFGQDILNLIGGVQSKLGVDVAQIFAQKLIDFQKELQYQLEDPKNINTEVLQNFLNALTTPLIASGSDVYEKYQGFLNSLSDLQDQITKTNTRNLQGDIDTLNQKVADLKLKYAGIENDRDNIIQFEKDYQSELDKDIQKLQEVIDKYRELNAARASGLPITPFVYVPGTGNNEGLLNPIPQYFVDGGQAKGTDTIPAMLSPGEFIMNADATKKFLPQLLHMNAFKGYANGGVVSSSNTFGDTIINLKGTDNQEYDAMKLAKSFKRLIRQGLISL